MKKYVKVRAEQMVKNAEKDLRTEFLAIIRLVFREVGSILREILIGLWEGLMGPQKAARRRSVKRTPSR